jgi:hypothetical protein
MAGLKRSKGRKEDRAFAVCFLGEWPSTRVGGVVGKRREQKPFREMKSEQREWETRANAAREGRQTNDLGLETRP